MSRALVWHLLHLAWSMQRAWSCLALVAPRVVQPDTYFLNHSASRIPLLPQALRSSAGNQAVGSSYTLTNANHSGDGSLLIELALREGARRAA